MQQLLEQEKKYKKIIKSYEKKKKLIIFLIFILLSEIYLIFEYSNTIKDVYIKIFVLESKLDELALLESKRINFEQCSSEELNKSNFLNSKKVTIIIVVGIILFFSYSFFKFDPSQSLDLSTNINTNSFTDVLLEKQDKNFTTLFEKLKNTINYVSDKTIQTIVPNDTLNINPYSQHSYEIWNDLTELSELSD